jgi:hypothetical protein
MQQIIEFIVELEKLKGVTRKRYINNVTEPVTTSAAAHMKSRLNHAVRRSARPNLRYTTQATRPVTAR